MSLALLDAQIKDEVMNILTPLCENDDDSNIVVGPKTNSGNLKFNKTFRVIYEEIETPVTSGENKARTFGGKYNLNIPIRITIMINSKQIEEAGMKSIQLISEVLDDIFLNKRFRKIKGVSDILLDNIITDASLDLNDPTSIGSGIKLTIKAMLNHCR
ncbi:MAG: hypothetical protein LBM02_08200 [Lachnospiraceae bacterium]|jgi:hypothetical protein|nr:hypothetical protein [Lachnospiraceae bacterium]